MLNIAHCRSTDTRPMRGALPLFRFLDACHARGERTVLVTLTDIVG